MPRNARKFQIEEGGFYHIVKRGINGEKIFRDNNDYLRLILGMEFFNDTRLVNLWDMFTIRKNNPRLLAERIQRARKNRGKPIAEIHGFCLMPNHVHFIMREIKKDGISSFMKKIGGFSTYFNKKYERTGTLFEGRFKAVPIKTDDQLANVFRYIHSNPVEIWEPKWKDFKVRRPKEAIEKLNRYKSSSYIDYIREENAHPFLTKKIFMKFFGGAENCRLAVEDWIKFKASEVGKREEFIE